MFSTIDNYLIRLAQWVVRQIELYTPITRAAVGDILLSFNSATILLCFWAGVSHTSKAISLSSNSSVFWSTLWIANAFFVVSFLEILFHKRAARIIKTKQKDGSLPCEIWVRKKERFLCLLFLSIFFSFFVKLALLPNNTISLEDFVLVVLISGDFLLEYFFCTTSLPPGEKERKKVEREMRSMSLQKISGN